jgi:hypothetical protein
VRDYFLRWLERDGYPFWPFWDHVHTWWQRRELPNVLLVHHRDLTGNLRGEIGRIASFLDIPVEPPCWDPIVAHCSIRHMQARAADIVPRKGAAFIGGAQTFLANGGVNGRWRDVLTAGDKALYGATAQRELGGDCAAWLAGGQRAGCLSREKQVRRTSRASSIKTNAVEGGERVCHRVPHPVNRTPAMVHIPDLPGRWAFYSRHARAISPYFRALPPEEGIDQAAIAKLVPFSAKLPLPAVTPTERQKEVAQAARARPPTKQDDGAPEKRKRGGDEPEERKPPGEPISGQAVSIWFNTDALSDARSEQWEDLTRIPVEAWAGDRPVFERAVLLAAGQVLGWPGLVQGYAKRGKMRVRVTDRKVGDRFFKDGDGPVDLPHVQKVWPECIAWIELPATAPKEEADDRRAWLFADYGDRINLLDPKRSPRDGTVTSSRIDRVAWRADANGGHVILPRGTPGHVWIPPGIKLGTKFEVIALTLNLTEEEEVRPLIDGLEAQMLSDRRAIGEDQYQKLVRATLNEVGVLLTTHDTISCGLYCQKCEVVSREEALGGLLA